MEFQRLGATHRRFLEHATRPLVIVIIAAISVRLLMSLGTNGILWPDSRAYYRSAALIAKFGNFHWHEIYRTPFYPLFMSAFFWLFGQTELAGFLIISAQRLLGVFSVVLVYKIARKNFGPGVAFYSSLLLALHTLQLYYETTLHTEPLFTFLLLLVLYVCDKFFDQATSSRAALIGFLCGILTLTRPLGQFVLPIVLIVFLLRERFSSQWWKTVAVSFSIFAAVLLPWMFTNKVYYKFFGLSQDLGLNLFHRIIDVEKIPPREKTEFPRVKRAWEAETIQHEITYFHVYHQLLKERIRRVKADRMMASFAIETLTQESGKYFAPYLKNVVVTFFDFFFRARRSVQFCGDPNGSYMCTKNTLGQREKAFSNNAENISSGKRAAVHKYFRVARLPMAFVSLLAMIGFVSALLHWRKSSPTILLTVLIPLYFALLTGIFNIPEDRFRLPMDPLLFVFAVSTVACAIRYCLGRMTKPEDEYRHAA